MGWKHATDLPPEAKKTALQDFAKSADTFENVQKRLVKNIIVNEKKRAIII